jgi:hypothetical protein
MIRRYSGSAHLNTSIGYSRHDVSSGVGIRKRFFVVISFRMLSTHSLSPSAAFVDRAVHVVRREWKSFRRLKSSTKPVADVVLVSLFDARHGVAPCSVLSLVHCLGVMRWGTAKRAPHPVRCRKSQELLAKIPRLLFIVINNEYAF